MSSFSGFNFHDHLTTIRRLRLAPQPPPAVLPADRMLRHGVRYIMSSTYTGIRPPQTESHLRRCLVEPRVLRGARPFFNCPGIVAGVRKFWSIMLRRYLSILLARLYRVSGSKSTYLA